MRSSFGHHVVAGDIVDIDSICARWHCHGGDRLLNRRLGGVRRGKRGNQSAGALLPSMLFIYTTLTADARQFIFQRGDD